MKVYELLDDPKKLIKNTAARDKKHKKVLAWSPEACKWCIIGAITKCYPDRSTSEIMDILIERIKMPIIKWNNKTSYKEIIEVLKELDI